jgi:hypothetical protein
MMKLAASASVLALVVAMSTEAAAQPQTACPANAATLFVSTTERSEGELLILARCPDPIAREFAIAALANAPESPRTITAVVDAVSDQAEAVRRQAVLSLRLMSPAGIARLADLVVADDAADTSTIDRYYSTMAASYRMAALTLLLPADRRDAVAARVRPDGAAVLHLRNRLSTWRPPDDPPDRLPRAWRDQLRIGQFCSGQAIARTRREALPVEEQIVTAMLRNELFDGWDPDSFSSTYCTRTDVASYAVELLGYFDRERLRQLVSEHIAGADRRVIPAESLLEPLALEPPALAEFLIASLSRSGRAGTTWMDLATEFFDYAMVADVIVYTPKRGREREAVRLVEAMAAHWAGIDSVARASGLRLVLGGLNEGDPRRDATLAASLASPSLIERHSALSAVCGQDVADAINTWTVSGSCQLPGLAAAQNADLEQAPPPLPIMAQVELTRLANDDIHTRMAEFEAEMRVRRQGARLPEQVIRQDDENPSVLPPPAPPPSPPPPPPVSPPIFSEPSLPAFPWPLPRPVRSEPLDTALFGGPDATLEQVHQRLRASIQAASPGFETGLFSGPPNGFVLLASTERIRSDGTPFDEPRRWTRGGNPQASFLEMLNNLRFERPGYFRVIAFVVADDLRVDPGQSINRIPLDNMDVQQLPRSLRSQRLGDRNVYAVVYAFQITQANVRVPWTNGAPTARTHLAESGIGSRLGLR